jgi:hypothetical protein
MTPTCRHCTRAVPVVELSHCPERGGRMCEPGPGTPVEARGAPGRRANGAERRPGAATERESASGRVAAGRRKAQTAARVVDRVELLPGETAADALARHVGGRTKKARPSGPTAKPRHDAPVPSDPRNLVAFVVPVITVNESNGDQGRIFAQAKKRKHVRGVTAICARIATRAVPQPPLVVVITRHSAGRLDPDGLASATKSVVDGCADWLGVNDRDEDAVRYVREQEKCARGFGWVTVQVRRRT